MDQEKLVRLLIKIIFYKETEEVVYAIEKYRDWKIIDFTERDFVIIYDILGKQSKGYPFEIFSSPLTMIILQRKDIKNISVQTLDKPLTIKELEKDANSNLPKHS